MKLIERFLSSVDQSTFLFGPRGTGKTTYLAQSLPEALNIDLLSEDVYRRLLARPESLKELIPNDVTCVVIDEIQRNPALLNTVHQIMEKRRDLKFVLTGSSARKLRRAGVDLLAGRAAVMNCHPFMAAEMGELFNLDNALKFGMVPVVAMSRNPAKTLEAYIANYLREEVVQEGLVRRLDSFVRFLEAASFSHGSTLNRNEVARDCETSRSTVDGYFSILHDLLLSESLPVFTRRAKRRLSAHDKFYFFDAGVFRALRPKGPIDSPSEIDGAALEGLVMQHLRAWADYRAQHPNLYYWRTVSGTEVDFVIYGEDVFTAIEVKNSTTIKKEFLKGLKAFHEDYPEAKLLLLYRGDHDEQHGEILCRNVAHYLQTLRP